MAPFSGWEMPISYADGGVLAEHTAVRETVGLFDVSHLGKVSVRGPGAADFVNRCFTADLARIAPGQAQYTMCCNESGGVVDDLIAYLVADDEVFLVPNAANAAAVTAALRAAAPPQVQIIDQHTEFGVLAVQGPASVEVLAALSLPTELDYMSWQDATVAGTSVRVCRTGYTGERGFELLPPWNAAEELWDALLAEVTARGGRPAGLGARDTLRLEMGYPLHGQDLTPRITPLQAKAGWAVGWDKETFFGRSALLTERAAGPTRRLWGLEALGRGVIRPDARVLTEDGAAIGTTTSGTFSPTLGHSIALALIDSGAGIAVGDTLTVQVRGRQLPVRVAKTPFVPSHVR